VSGEKDVLHRNRRKGVGKEGRHRNPKQREQKEREFVKEARGRDGRALVRELFCSSLKTKGYSKGRKTIFFGKKDALLRKVSLRRVTEAMQREKGIRTRKIA